MRAERLTTRDYDEIASQLLSEFASDFPEDIDLVISWVREAAANPAALNDLIRYKYKPVGPREFVESPVYMNKPGVLWPKVMDALCEMKDGTRTEAVLTGGIGVAKATLALYSQAYQLYLLSGMRNPHEEFDLDPSSEIVIIFQSLNKDLAKGVDYARFRDMIDKAPYFSRHFQFRQDLESELRFPNNIIVKPISGQDTGAIGQNVIGGVIDEINFMAVVENSKNSKDGEVYDQAIKNYNSIARRRESRFMQLGTLPGLLCLVSSRNYPGQFTDKKEVEARTNPRIYVYDKRLWEIRPERFVGDRFRVFVGDETRKPYILEADAVVAVEDEPLVMAIPDEYRVTFENDLLAALRDVAGVATQALHPFILQTEAVVRAFGKVQSLASRDDCDFKTTKLDLYPKRIVMKQEPRFAHIDLACYREHRDPDRQDDLCRCQRRARDPRQDEEVASRAPIHSDEGDDRLAGVRRDRVPDRHAPEEAAGVGRGDPGPRGPGVRQDVDRRHRRRAGFSVSEELEAVLVLRAERRALAAQEQLRERRGSGRPAQAEAAGEDREEARAGRLTGTSRAISFRKTAKEGRKKSKLWMVTSARRFIQETCMLSLTQWQVQC